MRSRIQLSQAPETASVWLRNSYAPARSDDQPSPESQEKFTAGIEDAVLQPRVLQPTNSIHIRDTWQPLLQYHTYVRRIRRGVDDRATIRPSLPERATVDCKSDAMRIRNNDIVLQMQIDCIRRQDANRFLWPFTDTNRVRNVQADRDLVVIDGRQKINQSPGWKVEVDLDGYAYPGVPGLRARYKTIATTYRRESVRVGDCVRYTCVTGHSGRIRCRFRARPHVGMGNSLDRMRIPKNRANMAGARLPKSPYAEQRQGRTGTERSITAGSMPGAISEHGVDVLRCNQGIEPGIELFVRSTADPFGLLSRKVAELQSRHRTAISRPHPGMHPNPGAPRRRLP